MKRFAIKKDGHCLPRSVFRGAKNLDLLEEYIKYSELLADCVVDIKANITDYEEFLQDGVEESTRALHIYAKERKYALEDNILDTVIVALASRTRCEISVHYQRADGGFYQHNYPPKTEPEGKFPLYF